MATGPNFIALSEIKSPNQQTRYEQPSTNNNVQQLERILQNNRQFEAVMKNLKKQFDYLGATNTHITEFYPQFIYDNVYIDDAEKTVIYDDSMGSLIFKLQKENQELKIQLKAWMQQFGKKAYLTQLLVKENKTLQDQIILQDKDLIKIIDTLSGKESEELQELEDKMNELKVENGVLIQHLSDIQEEISTKKQYQFEQNNNLQQYQKVLNETKQKLAQTSEEEDHQTKFYAMVKSIVDNLTLNLSEMDQQETHLNNQNIQLNTDKHELSYHLKNYKTEIGDMQNNIVNQNNEKTNEQKLLNRQKNSLDEQLKYSLEKVKKLEGEIAREDRMIEHYSKAFGQAEIKVRNSTQHLNSVDANLSKQLERQTERGAEIMTARYQIQLLEGDIELIRSQRKQHESQYPGKAKHINDQFQTEKKQLDKELQDLQMQQSKALMNLNNQVLRQKSELERAQRELHEKNEDLKDAKNEQIQIKRLKGVIRELGAVLRQKVAEVNSLT